MSDGTLVAVVLIGAVALGSIVSSMAYWIYRLAKK